MRSVGAPFSTMRSDPRLRARPMVTRVMLASECRAPPERGCARSSTRMICGWRASRRLSSSEVGVLLAVSVFIRVLARAHYRIERSQAEVYEGQDGRRDPGR